MLPKAFVNIILMGGMAVGRALVGAYKEALARAATDAARQATTQAPKMSSYMSVGEAKKILGVETPTAEEILSKYQKLWEINEPKNGGSPYIRSKIEGAKQVLEEQVKKGAKF